MKRFYSKKTSILILLSVFLSVSMQAQIPIDCSKFYLHDVGGTITGCDPITLATTVNAISTPAAGNGLAVSNNLNSGFPAVTFYTTVGGQYHYYNGTGWTNTGHNCTNAAAVNICGAGPYIYNLVGAAGQVYRYNGSGNDVLVMTMPSFDGPYDLIGDDNGNFYALYTNAGFQKLAKYSPAGALLCTYTLINMPNNSSGGGYAIVGNKIFVAATAGNFVGNIVGTNITFTPLAGLPGTIGDFGSCPFPQLSSGISNPTNLTCTTLSTILTATSTVTGPSYSWSGPGIVSGSGTSVVTVNQPGIYTVVITGSGGACPGASTSTINVTQNGIPPTVSASSSGAVTCANSAVNLSASPAGMNYVWTAPAGSSITSGVNSQNAVGSGGGTYTVTVTNPIGGCSASNVVTVAGNTTPPSVSAGGGGVLTCSTPNLTLSGSSGSSVNYNWSGPGIVSGGATANPVVNQPGTYNLTVTDASNGCTANTSVNVTQNITPPTASAAAAGSGVLTCNVTSLNLNATPASGVNYSWSGPGIVSGGSTANPVVNQPGVYTLVVTNPANGCSNSSSPASVSVTQNITAPTGVAASAVGTSTLNCSITTINLSGSPSTGVTYSWSGPGIVSGGNTANPVVNQPGAYSLVVTNTSNGCSNASAPAVVSISQASVNIAGSATTNSIITCVSTSANLNANPAGYTYTWTAPGGSSVTSGVNSQNAMGSGPGTYSVIIKDVSTGCFILSTVTIPQNITTPTGVSAASGDTIFCNTPTVTLSSTPGTGVTYSWSGPGIVSGGNTANPTVNAAGSYSLVVTNTSNGCSNTASPAVVNVIANVTLPTGVNAGPNAVLPCNPGTISLSGVSTSTNITYSWGGPNNYSFSGQNPNNINSPGQYTLTVTDNHTGCSFSDTMSVATQSVLAAFTPDPSTGVVPLVVNFTNNSIGETTYSWDFNDGNVSIVSDPQNTFTNTGTYTVVLIVFNGAGTCSDTATAVITVESDFTLIIPNVFTPNGDGANDDFIIRSTGVKEISCDIFNRWGEKMFTITSPNQSWDGLNANGSKASDGTYLYILRVVPFRGEPVEKQGAINLFR